jgi:peptide-methionine (S)-S-oxide reductase
MTPTPTRIEISLEFFFQIHDPTTLSRQGDGEEQRRTALETVADVNESGLWPGPVVTEVVAAGPFWEASEDDQHYLLKHPDGETCHFVRPGWKLPHRASRAL